MTERRNFDPRKPDADYEHKHIKLRVVVDVDLHNVGDEFSLSDAATWLDEALERGLTIADPNDKAVIVKGSATLLSRPDCQCYGAARAVLTPKQPEKETQEK